jgi:hypothetical protein
MIRTRKDQWETGNFRKNGAKVEIVRGLLPTDNVILNPADSLVSGTAVRMAPPRP